MRRRELFRRFDGRCVRTRVHREGLEDSGSGGSGGGKGSMKGQGKSRTSYLSRHRCQSLCLPLNCIEEEGSTQQVYVSITTSEGIEAWDELLTREE